MKATGERIVLALSGKLDPAAVIPWLKDCYGAHVIAVTLDFGRGKELESCRDRALGAGATRAHVLDTRDEFVCSFILPALKAEALSGEGFQIVSALARPLMARKLVEIAEIEQATAVAHEYAGDGGTAARLEAMIRALNPTLKIIAPSREWTTSFKGSDSHSVRVVNRSPAWRGETACVEIAFDRGVPVAVNGVTMSLVDLISSLGTIAGASGVGGASCEICDGPATAILHQAHHDLQQLVVEADLDRFSQIVSRKYADLIHDDLWLTPLRPALDAFVERVQERVTGVVRLQLLNSGCRVIGHESPFALDDQDTQEVAAGCGVME